jgi:hypothetical protein
MRVHSTGLRLGINPGRLGSLARDFTRGSAIGNSPSQDWNRPEIDPQSTRFRYSAHYLASMLIAI